MECAQINVTGSSGSKTPSTVSFPGAYKGSDPGMRFDCISQDVLLKIVSFAGVTLSIYWPPVTNYTIPGTSIAVYDPLGC